MQNQKGVSALILIIIIVAVAVVAVGGVFAYQFSSKKIQLVSQQNKNQQQQTVNQQTNNVQPINQTAGWKTYTNSQYGFEIKYPSDWKISDTSSTNSGVKYPAVSIESPLRSDLTGYQGTPVSYRILIYMPDGKITSIADFGSNQKPAQSWWNIEVNKAVKEASPEYLIGQQIISTFKFTK